MTGILRVLKYAVLSLGILLLAVTVTPLDAIWTRYLAGPWNDPKGDVLIVLGADSVGDVIGESSYWRSVYAVRVWRAGGFRRILISGGPGSGGAIIAGQMRDFLICQNVPAAVIEVENRSRSTRENAVYTGRMLAGETGRFVLLTSDYHMFRAFRAFRKAGIPVQPRPFPDAGKRLQRWDLRWNVFLDLCTESAKSIYYWRRGWI